MSGRFQRTGVALLTATLFTLAARVPAQLPPDQALAAMKVADGLEVTLFASEPDLFNPTAMDIDAEGRIWVVEAVNYRTFRQPATRTEGDRVRVLEDTDGDGKADKATTFYQDPSMQAPLGIAVLGKRVLICESPDLFYLEDTDGDGKADKKTVILTGFKGVDHDHAIHGAHFGPDGWIYMTNGDEGLDVSDKSGQRVQAGKGGGHKSATVLRTDPEGNHLELLAEDLRNPYEPAIDSFGNLFASDNDDDGNEQVRIVHILRGGDYGYRPRRRGDAHSDAVHWNEDRPGVIPKILRTGAGSPTGICFYEGSLLPQQWRRSLIHADAGPGVIRSYPLTPSGASYKAGMDTLLSCPSDKWFRPSDVCTAPDGSIFVADWYDPGVGGHGMGDVKRGRIYRIAPKGTKGYKVPKLDLTTRYGVADALASPNLAARYLAYQAFKKNEVVGIHGILLSYFYGSDPVLRARALWLLADDKADGDRALEAALSDGDPLMRALGVRILALHGPEALQARAESLLSDSDSGVRRELLLQLGPIKDEWAMRLKFNLARQYDGVDRYYREAVGIAFRGQESEAYNEIMDIASLNWDATVAGLALELHPPQALATGREVAANGNLTVPERVQGLEIIGAVGGEEAGEALASFLKPGVPTPMRKMAFQLMIRDADTPMRKGIEKEPGLREGVLAALSDRDLSESAKDFITAAGLSDFTPDLMVLAQDRSLSDEAREGAVEALRSIAQRKPGDRTPFPDEFLRKMLDDPNEDVRESGLRLVGVFHHDGAMQMLTGVMTDPKRERGMRRMAVRLLGGSKAGSVALLKMAEEGMLPAEVRLDASSVTHASPYEDVRLMADQLLPREQTKEGKALPPIADLLKMKGDAAKGKTAFYSQEGAQCYRCHKIAGEGKDVGPDLSKIGGKLSREGIFESVLNPSGAIQHEYEVWILRTESSGYLTGYIRSENAEGVELMDASGTPVKIPAAEILERRKSATSLMPTGLTEGMTVQDLVDLVDYLSTLK